MIERAEFPRRKAFSTHSAKTIVKRKDTLNSKFDLCDSLAWWRGQTDRSIDAFSFALCLVGWRRFLVDRVQDLQ